MAPRRQARKGGRERTFFVMTPQLVWALCENPYQLALWTVIQMIAGEDGECTLDTRDLAALAMMSAGKCQQARQALIRLGLVRGRLYRETGRPRAVWHLSIPNLWALNQEWREDHHSLYERVAYKRAQRRGEVAEVVDLGEDRSADEQCRSSGEQCRSSDERGRSPRETKEIQQEAPKGEEEVYLGGIWKQALAEFEMQVTRATFGMWIRPLALVGLEGPQIHGAESLEGGDGEQGSLSAVLRCPNAYVQDWCAARLDVVIRRTLAGILGQAVEVAYIVEEE